MSTDCKSLQSVSEDKLFWVMSMKRCGVDNPCYILCYRSVEICDGSVGSTSLRGPKSACYRSLKLFFDPCFCYRKVYKTRVRHLRVSRVHRIDRQRHLVPAGGVARWHVRVPRESAFLSSLFLIGIEKVRMSRSTDIVNISRSTDIFNSSRVFDTVTILNRIFSR